MISAQKIEIPISKSKIILLLFGTLIFVALGLWFVIDPALSENNFGGNRTKIVFIGYASVIFFGICFLYLLYKLSDNRPGLIIDDLGLLDNSSGISAGLILWSDIDEISVIEIYRQKLIMIKVKNPDDYINRETALLKRKSMYLNNRLYGTPLSLSANGLKISPDELLTLLTTTFNQIKERRSASIR